MIGAQTILGLLLSSLIGIIILDALRGIMPEKAKADLDKLDTLRDLALCGPEDKREESQRAYEELRSELLVHDQCKACEDDTNTKELTMKDKDNETAKQYTKEKETIYDWDSNRDLENPDNIAWPKENEAKD